MIVNLPSSIYVSRSLDGPELDKPAQRADTDEYELPETAETIVFTRLTYRHPLRKDPLEDLNDGDILRGWKYHSEKSGWGEVLGEGDGRIGPFRDVVEDR